jgi:hypothetical protein
VNRPEAIRHLKDLTNEVAGEYNPMDALGLRAETRAALRALGVTDAEIDDAEVGVLLRDFQAG